MDSSRKKAAVLKFNPASVNDKCQTNNDLSNKIDASFSLS
jgi:hypothetical protein